MFQHFLCLISKTPNLELYCNVLYYIELYCAVNFILEKCLLENEEIGFYLLSSFVFSNTSKLHSGYNNVTCPFSGRPARITEKADSSHNARVTILIHFPDFGYHIIWTLGYKSLTFITSQMDTLTLHGYAKNTKELLEFHPTIDICCISHSIVIVVSDLPFSLSDLSPFDELPLLLRDDLTRSIKVTPRLSFSTSPSLSPSILDSSSFCSSSFSWQWEQFSQQLILSDLSFMFEFLFLSFSFSFGYTSQGE